MRAGALLEGIVIFQLKPLRLNQVVSRCPESFFDVVEHFDGDILSGGV